MLAHHSVFLPCSSFISLPCDWPLALCLATSNGRTSFSCFSFRDYHTGLSFMCKVSLVALCFASFFFKSCVCESIVFFFFWNSMDRVDFSSSCCQGILQEQGNRILAYMSENGSLFFIHILLLLYVILLTIGRQHNLLTCNFFSLMCTGFAVFNKHQWIFFMLASLMHLRDVRHCWYRTAIELVKLLPV